VDFLLKFKDRKITNLDLESPENVSHLIVSCLCGENNEAELAQEDRKLVEELMKNAKQSNMNHSQLNELLLLLNQDIIGEDFFKFFFGEDKISLGYLKKGIINFCGFAMLCFGNLKRAYKSLAQKSKEDIRTELLPYSRKSSDLIKEYQNRPRKMLKINKISKDKTWLVGELADITINKEGKLLKQEIEKSQVSKRRFDKKRADGIWRNDLPNQRG